MQIRILIVTLMVGILTANSSLCAQIQMGSGMKMNLSVNDETNQLWKDLANRRVSISPLSTSISNTSKKVSLEFHNPTDDTLEMNIQVSNTVSFL